MPLRKQTTIRSTSHQIEGLLNDKAAAVEGSNKQLGLDLTQAKSDLAAQQSELGGELELARQKTARFQRDAEKEKKARLQLEARIAPRTLDEGQRKYVGESLSPYAFKFFGRKVNLYWLLSDAESTVFGIELEDSLKRAGIESERPGVIPLGRLDIGIHITGPMSDALFAKTLFDILEKYFPNEALTVDTTAKYNGSPVTVIIGVKTPIGFDTLPLPPGAVFVGPAKGP